MAKKVMIVDDEADLCETVKLLLESKGFGVATALSGPEALGKLKKEKVDLALIDYFMPEMTGRDLADKIRADPKLKDLKLAFLIPYIEARKTNTRRNWAYRPRPRAALGFSHHLFGPTWGGFKTMTTPTDW